MARRSGFRHPKPTLEDVAARAQTSISSVSRVLNDYPGVHPGLRARIRRALEELGYTPSAGRKRPAASRRRVFTFLLSNRGLNVPVYSRILQVVETEAGHQGDLLLFRSIRYTRDTAPEDLSVSGLLTLPSSGGGRRGVDGVILTGLTYPNLVEALTESGVPFVLLGNNYVGPPLDRDTVLFDGLEGARQAVSYLVDLGHRHILFVGDPNIGWFSGVYEGYLEAVTVAGLKPLAQAKTLSDSFFFNGYLSVELAFQDFEGITAVFAGCDEIALGAWKALGDRNLSVPRDVSLVGFDDEDYAAFTVPPLTTVRVDADAIGRELIRQLYRKLESRGVPLPTVTLPATLVKRGTCRPLGVLSGSVG